MVQWLGLQASTARGADLIPDQGARILHAVQHDQKMNVLKQPKDQMTAMYPETEINDIQNSDPCG